MKILLTGATGQLGRSCRQEFATDKLILATSANCNLRNSQQCYEFVRQAKPDVIIHTAAYTNVRGAETDAETCYAVNAQGTAALAKAARSLDAVMVYISTDYVFDGHRSRPYREDDAVNPLNVYGRSKLAGELAVRALVPRHFVLRTSWLHGEGKNFLTTILARAETQPEVKVVANQYGSPTFTTDLARFIRVVVESKTYGLYHATNSGFATWAELAQAALEIKGKNTTVVLISSRTYQRLFGDLTPRPRSTILDSKKLQALTPIRSWREALVEYLA